MADKAVIIFKVDGSTDIDSIGFNKQTKTLGVKFREQLRRGRMRPPQIYLFPDQTWELFREFCAAPSKGKFFAAHIKGTKFEKVT